MAHSERNSASNNEFKCYDFIQFHRTFWMNVISVFKLNGKPNEKVVMSINDDRRQEKRATVRSCSCCVEKGQCSNNDSSQSVELRTIFRLCRTEWCAWTEFEPAQCAQTNHSSSSIWNCVQCVNGNSLNILPLHYCEQDVLALESRQHKRIIFVHNALRRFLRAKCSEFKRFHFHGIIDLDKTTFVAAHDTMSSNYVRKRAKNL